MEEQERTTEAKSRMLIALVETYGIIGPACIKVGITRTTHYHWINNDPDYKKAFNETLEFQKDFVESKIISNINAGDGATMRFYAATKMRDRGYIYPKDISEVPPPLPPGQEEEKVVILIPHNNRDDQNLLNGSSDTK